VTITYNGITFLNTEAAYQAAKFPGVEDLFVGLTGKEAKALSKKLAKDCRPDWNDIRLQVMMDVTKLKYEQEPYRSQLVATGNELLEEGNWWRDTFWGVDSNTGRGHNNLGKILMVVRRNIKNNGK
jgi:ribA/ribD-fused uncharacterized protein